MIELIGQTLSTAVAIAISPVPIIATVIMLIAPRARASGVGFAVGWLAGILAATGLLSALLISLADSGPRLGPTVRALVLALLGVVLIALAVRQFRNRARASVPAWMNAVDKMSVTHALALGFALAALNPKNLTLSAAAGVEIGAAELNTAQTLVATCLFALIAASSVLLPVATYLASPERMATPLTALKNWLTANNSAVMATLLAVLGTILVGKALALL